MLGLLVACAQTTPLQGGPKDTHAPAIDSAKTYPANGQLNFADDEIRMRFNEYIQLNKPTDNIIIIPNMETPPEFLAKNKRLTIKFNEPLQDNTTYLITFNGAIQDITEKNDSVFQYVFSTGNYIDSLEVRGTVKNAFENTPMSQVLVGLYPKTLEAHFDSIPIKFKPTYLVQTDERGAFNLRYLKGGQYYIFAITDKNKNLKYDPDEFIALTEIQDFNLDADSIPVFDLRAFRTRSSEVEIEDVNFTFPGKVEVILSNPTDSFRVDSNLPLVQEYTERKDSLIFWLEKSPIKNMRFYTELKGELDTLKPIYKDVPEKIEDVKLTQKNNVVTGKLLPKEWLSFQFSEPIGEIDPNGIHFYDLDSAEVVIDSIEVDVRELRFKTWDSPARRVVIDSAAIQSFYGRENDAEIKLEFESNEEDYYGALIVSVDTSYNEDVIVHLLNSKKEIVAIVPFESKMRFDKLLPGEYQLRLIFDVDKNGEWTTGSLSEALEPEKVFYNSEAIKVKSKWEKEIDWQLNGE